MRVLVIDDEEMIRDLAQKILTKAGYNVLLAESGQDGFRLYSENSHKIDLVLLDLIMEDVPGVETLQRIRKISPDVPCIISSGQAPTPGDIPDELNRNTYFLQKPYRAGQLTEMVKQIAVEVSGSQLT